MSVHLSGCVFLNTITPKRRELERLNLIYGHYRKERPFIRLYCCSWSVQSSWNELVCTVHFNCQIQLRQSRGKYKSWFMHKTLLLRIETIAQNFAIPCIKTSARGVLRKSKDFFFKSLYINNIKIIIFSCDDWKCIF